MGARVDWMTTAVIMGFALRRVGSLLAGWLRADGVDQVGMLVPAIFGRLDGVFDIRPVLRRDIVL